MAAKVEVDVKTISTEIIKPSSPTPCHLKSFTLSLVDQIHPPYYSIMLLFYPKLIDSPPGVPDIDLLKSSLSETLSKFYPFAGRFKDIFTVSCNDQGIPFIETRVECVLSDFLTSSNKVDHLHKLMPPKEYTAEKALPELVPLAIQVNVFSCGGVVIGCYKLHKLLLDGTSLVVFLKHWAAVAKTRGCNSGTIVTVEPDFDAVFSAFPPRPTLGWMPFNANSYEHQTLVEQYEGINVVAKSFVFTKQAITELRTSAASVEVPKPTRVEALAGFVWEHCMAAGSAAGAMPLGPDPSVMSFLINMRPRLQPPLPSVSMGNLITLTSARANETMGLPDLVKSIHGAVLNINDRIDSYQGGQNVEALAADLASPIAWYKPGIYGLSSWCQFGLDEVDFGFGKPKWASPTDGIHYPLSRNFIYLVNDTKGDGIEAWLFLEEMEMKILESNKNFLSYAYPN
ncbi:stemmadenine O-acetyltransferase-like [Silene latifolia]|uniref:stemmadenine O-acetyltransferase-like n=1 Tax=Silene latifolia TaxID=37657 RepID=UPI003D77D410